MHPRLHSCHITDKSAPTMKLVCGHTDKNKDQECRGCLRSMLESWDEIMERVQKLWAKRRGI